MQGIPIIISGPAGSGKGTVISHLLKNNDFTLSVSATTRLPREGELHGTHYFFLSMTEFDDLIAKGEMLEWAMYSGNYYGTPKKFVQDKLTTGANVILEIEVQGAWQVKQLLPDALMIFIAPPDFATLERRLRGRGTNTEDDIRTRLARAKEEFNRLDLYDYLLLTYDNKSSDTAQQIRQLIACEQYKTARASKIINNFFEVKYDPSNL